LIPVIPHRLDPGQWPDRVAAADFVLPAPETRMTSTENTRAFLVAKQQDLLDRLARIERDRRRDVQQLSADSEERALETENDEVLDRLADTTADEVAQIHHALERLDAGLHGVCEQCGSAIGVERLRALPESTRCTVCAPADSQPLRRGASRVGV
jgi:RNA polymerase-binding transcription factor DksA